VTRTRKTATGLLFILTFLFYFCYCSGQGRTKWWASRAAAQGANLKGALRCDLNNRKYAFRKVRIPHSQVFIGKLPAIWARARKKFRQPCPKLRKFQEYQFEGEPHF
jgi:hypothetical protein